MSSSYHDFIIIFKRNIVPDEKKITLSKKYKPFDKNYGATNEKYETTNKRNIKTDKKYEATNEKDKRSDEKY